MLSSPEDKFLPMPIWLSVDSQANAGNAGFGRTQKTYLFSSVVKSDTPLPLVTINIDWSNKSPTTGTLNKLPVDTSVLNCPHTEDYQESSQLLLTISPVDAKNKSLFVTKGQEKFVPLLLSLLPSLQLKSIASTAASRSCLQDPSLHHSCSSSSASFCSCKHMVQE